MQKSLESSQFKGIVHLGTNQKTIFHHVQGMADRESLIPITDHTAFGIASGTKFLTGLAIGKLIDKGLLSLETKVDQIVPAIRDLYDPTITIRHLLSHTSGMPDYYDEDAYPDADNVILPIPNDKLLTPSDFIPMFPKDPMRHLPGERFIYNNQGFVVLALAIESLTNKPYADVINQDLLKPLGITRSGIFYIRKCPAHIAKGYVRIKDEFIENIGRVPEMSGGDGGASFTLHDMKRLYEAFFRGEIISRELVLEYVSPQTIISKEDGSAYGLGLWLEQKNDGPWIPTLYGGDAGISFTSSYHPLTQTFGFAVSNTSDGVWNILSHYKNAFLAIALGD